MDHINDAAAVVRRVIDVVHPIPSRVGWIGPSPSKWTASSKDLLWPLTESASSSAPIRRFQAEFDRGRIVFYEGCKTIRVRNISSVSLKIRFLAMGRCSGVKMPNGKRGGIPLLPLISQALATVAR